MRHGTDWPVRYGRRDGTDGVIPRAFGVAAGALLLLGVVFIVVTPRVGAQACAKEDVKIGIVEAKGCFTSRTPSGQAPVYETTEAFQMNGFSVKPHSGVKVTFSPADGNKRGASVTTNNGFVDFSATGPSGSDFVHFNNLNLAFSPPSSGEFTLVQSALAQPAPVIFGLTPLSVTQPIVLSEGESSFTLNFALSGLLGRLMTGSDSERSISFGLPFGVKDGTATATGVKFGASDIEIAKVLTVNSLDLDIEPPKVIDVSGDVGLAKVSNRGLLLGVSIEDGVFSQAHLGLSGINQPIGTSGVFLQKLSGQVFTAPPYGGSGTVGISAGPKINFFGKGVDALGADGTITVRGADIPNKKPGFFRVDGAFTVVSLPVANAHFQYDFGLGTQFGASVGIGLPSATNDPGQPTYIGGSFNGWTTARHFDLESKINMKVLGISLVGAQAVLSDVGIAGCAQVGLWFGGGVHWSNGRGEVLGGWTCDLGGYRPQRSARRGLRSDGSARLHLEEEEQVVRISAADGEAAPQATLTDEDGRTLESPEETDEDGVEESDDGVATSDDFGNSHFVIPEDADGDWQLQQGPGSTGIESISVATTLPHHSVEAEIAGSGRHRILRWDARDLRHQRLQFSEKLPDGREIPIFETKDNSGRRRFIPAEGTGTYGVKRELAVDVMQRHYTPRDELVADRYVVRRQPAPRRVERMHAERRLHDLVVSWQPSGRAASYEVLAETIGDGDGATYLKRVDGDRRRARFSGIGTDEKLRVAVRPVNGQGRSGGVTRRIVDTENLVTSRRAAARQLVDDAHLTAARRVVANPECPDGGHCKVTLRVSDGNRRVGSGHVQLPPDMTDRLVVKLRGGDAGDLRLRARVAQLDGSARSSGPLRG